MGFTAATKAGGRRIKASRRPTNTVQVLVVDKHAITVEKINRYKLDDRCWALVKNGDRVIRYEINGLVVHRTSDGRCQNLMNIGLSGTRAVIYQKNCKPLTIGDYTKWAKEQDDIISDKMVKDHKDLFAEEEEEPKMTYQQCSELYPRLLDACADKINPDNIVEVVDALENTGVLPKSELPEVPDLLGNMMRATVDTDEPVLQGEIDEKPVMYNGISIREYHLEHLYPNHMATMDIVTTDEEQTSSLTEEFDPNFDCTDMPALSEE